MNEAKLSKHSFHIWNLIHLTQTQGEVDISSQKYWAEKIGARSIGIPFYLQIFWQFGKGVMIFYCSPDLYCVFMSLSLSVPPIEVSNTFQRSNRHFFIGKWGADPRQNLDTIVRRRMANSSLSTMGVFNSWNKPVIKLLSTIWPCNV